MIIHRLSIDFPHGFRHRYHHDSTWFQRVQISCFAAHGLMSSPRASFGFSPSNWETEEPDAKEASQARSLWERDGPLKKGLFRPGNDGIFQNFQSYTVCLEKSDMGFSRGVFFSFFIYDSDGDLVSGQRLKAEHPPVMYSQWEAIPFSESHR